MRSSAIVTRLVRAGWEVWVEDGNLQLRHATQTLTDTQLQYLTSHKAALLATVDAVLAAEEQAALAADAVQAHPMPAQTATGDCVHVWVTGCEQHAGILHCTRCAAVFVPAHQATEAGDPRC